MAAVSDRSKMKEKKFTPSDPPSSKAVPLTSGPIETTNQRTDLVAETRKANFVAGLQSSKRQPPVQPALSPRSLQNSSASQRNTEWNRHASGVHRRQTRREQWSAPIRRCWLGQPIGGAGPASVAPYGYSGVRLKCPREAVKANWNHGAGRGPKSNKHPATSTRRPQLFEALTDGQADGR